MPLIGEKDPDAFEVFYDRHGGVAYSLAYRIVGERGAAEDVIQEAFISIWRSGARYDRARGSVRSWMLGIVRNRAIDALRSKAGRAPKLDFDDDAILEHRPAAELTEAEALRRETAQRVARRAGRAAGRAVEGDRAGLLRRLQPLGDRGDAGRAAGHGEGTDATRLGEDSRTAGGGIGMNETEHDRRRDELAAYVLGALGARRGGGAGAPPRRLRGMRGRAATGCEPRCSSCPSRSSGSSRRRSCALA